jgi:DNA-binding NtrC family response regulator
MVDEMARNMGKDIGGVAEESLDRLRRYPWPGNVRELRNVVERAIILSRGGLLNIEPPGRRSLPEAASLVLRDVERRHIVSVLDLSGWRVRGTNGAAEILGIPPTTLEARMTKLGIRRPSRTHDQP